MASGEPGAVQGNVIPNPTDEALIGSFQVRGVTDFLERQYQDEVTKSRQSQGIWMKLKDIWMKLKDILSG